LLVNKIATKIIALQNDFTQALAPFFYKISKFHQHFVNNFSTIN